MKQKMMFNIMTYLIILIGFGMIIGFLGRVLAPVLSGIAFVLIGLVLRMK